MDAGLWALLRMPAVDVDDDDFLDYNDNEDFVVVLSTTSFAALALALTVDPILAVVAIVSTPAVVCLIGPNAMSASLACGGNDDDGMKGGRGCGCLVSRCHMQIRCWEAGSIPACTASAHARLIMAEMPNKCILYIADNKK